MGHVLLLLVVALTVAAVVFGVTVLVSGRDPGLAPAEPDGRAVPLPAARPLRESDVGAVRFDTAARGYRMAQVDQALRRVAYDIGYKSELIDVLEAEVKALREGRTAEADALRRAREQAAAVAPTAPSSPDPDGPVAGEPVFTAGGDRSVTVAAADPVTVPPPTAPSVDRSDADPARDAEPPVLRDAEPPVLRDAAAPVEAAGESTGESETAAPGHRETGSAATLDGPATGAPEVDLDGTARSGAAVRSESR
ncbi:DivIVA domain-containing protein [Micromonospora mirobrigensis]|uniref:DivIVA domain-containing protein n=1 Tax=Micromonospora mirobrigensis TaxID=262898 RepID=A0A1C4UZU0_9ACTN|nr:DivIVA domain-containing protein [Micromonospora mirobrigensis]SCE77268.1 DivIVA domain-containing protein [Micromonospora mirobrigensis]